MSDGDSDTQVLDGIVSLEVQGGSQPGSCDFSGNAMGSPDHIYAIDLQAGEELSVDWDTGINESGTSYGVMYLLGSCGDISSCITNGGTYSLSGENDALSYTNNSGQAETVYLYVGRTLGATSSYDYQITTNIN